MVIMTHTVELYGIEPKWIDNPNHLHGPDINVSRAGFGQLALCLTRVTYREQIPCLTSVIVYGFEVNRVKDHPPVYYQDKSSPLTQSNFILPLWIVTCQWADPAYNSHSLDVVVLDLQSKAVELIIDLDWLIGLTKWLYRTRWLAVSVCLTVCL